MMSSFVRIPVVLKRIILKQRSERILTVDTGWRWEQRRHLFFHSTIIHIMNINIHTSADTLWHQSVGNYREWRSWPYWRDWPSVWGAERIRWHLWLSVWSLDLDPFFFQWYHCSVFCFRTPELPRRSCLICICIAGADDARQEWHPHGCRDICHISEERKQGDRCFPPGWNAGAN